MPTSSNTQRTNSVRRFRVLNIGMAQAGHPTGTISVRIVSEHLKSQPVDEIVLPLDQALELQANLAGAITTAWKIRQREANA